MTLLQNLPDIPDKGPLNCLDKDHDISHDVFNFDINVYCYWELFLGGW